MDVRRWFVAYRHHKCAVLAKVLPCRGSKIFWFIQPVSELQRSALDKFSNDHRGSRRYSWSTVRHRCRVRLMNANQVRRNLTRLGNYLSKDCICSLTVFDVCSQHLYTSLFCQPQ